jgi:hypothetical protein
MSAQYARLTCRDLRPINGAAVVSPPALNHYRMLRIGAARRDGLAKAAAGTEPPNWARVTGLQTVVARATNPNEFRVENV